MKKLLIVSPHFPPVNAPDMQRVRLILPHLRANGWEPTVLAVSPESVEGAVVETPLLATVPEDIRVIRVEAVRASTTRWFGIGSLWWRARGALTAAGDALLREEAFDLVFLSTTQFGAFTLGPRWRRRFGVPYVLDYQDPWINDYYERGGLRPPGGTLKFAVSQWSAKRAEPRVLREAAAVVAVSSEYPQALARRYPWFKTTAARVIPFGASAGDFDVIQGYRPARPLIDFDDGNLHYVYVGRGGADMATAITILFRAFRTYQQSGAAAAARIRFHFIGTDYAPPPGGRDSALPLAKAEGVSPAVTEHRGRVPYFDALYYLRSASAVFLIGSDDAAYSASKIFPYILARRPLLLIAHRDSSMLALANRLSAGVAFGFAGAEEKDGVAADVAARWFAANAAAKPASFDEAAFESYLAPTLTRQLTRVFDECV